MKVLKCKICQSNTTIWYKRIYDDRHGYPGYFNIRKCVSCGFAQTNPQLGKNKIIKLYSDYYPRKNINLDSIKLKNYKVPKKDFLWRKGLGTGCHFWVKPKSKVLDIGSGVGYSLMYLKNNKCEAYGIDPDTNALKVAKKNKLNFHQGFIEDNPFQGNDFDFITASQVLEHINNPIEFLETIKKRLKDNGKVILSFPNVNSLTRKIFGKDWLHWHVPYHLNYFNSSSIKILMQKTGFKIIKIKTITPNLWTNLQIRRILSKPKMGFRDSFWDGTTPVSPSTKKLNNKTIKRILNFLEGYNYLNRLIDFLGFGESFLIILKKV